MSDNDKIDAVTGKVKEAAGKVTGEPDLEDEGKAQHEVAKAKDSVKDAAGKVGDAVRDAVSDEGKNED